MSKKVLYLCDGYKPECNKRTCYKEKSGECRHTSDIAHAINFNEISDESYAEQLPSNEKNMMKMPVTQLQLAEWSRMSLESVHRVRSKANISMCVTGINLLMLIILAIIYFIK